MKRKKWTKIGGDDIILSKIREKRKWQIAVRRYLIDGNLCRTYAPYFGLDIQKLREWFEKQLPPDISWDEFGKRWQIVHVIPVTYFDFSNDDDLKLCWNFLNLRIGLVEEGYKFDIHVAMSYFEKIYGRTNYTLCLRFLEKLQAIKNNLNLNSENQQAFIESNKAYLQLIDGFTAFEFELLNLGRNPEEVKSEEAFYKEISVKLNKQQGNV